MSLVEVLASCNQGLLECSLGRWSNLQYLKKNKKQMISKGGSCLCSCQNFKGKGSLWELAIANVHRPSCAVSSGHKCMYTQMHT